MHTASPDRPLRRTVRPGALLALVLTVAGGCTQRGCGGAGPSVEALPLAERRAIPGALAFVSERNGQKDVWLVTPAGEERPLTRGPADEYPAAVRPDGRALAVAAAREEKGVHLEQLMLLSLEEGAHAPEPLARPSARSRAPSWGPDGTWLVAESDATGFSDLVQLRVGSRAEGIAGGSTPAPRRLTEVREGAFEPAVSPDGKQLAFVSSHEGDPELYVMDLAGGPPRRLTFFHLEDVSPAWSPDGRWLAFLSNREGRDRVFVVRPDGTDLRAVSGAQTHGDERDLAWRPDSHAIAFAERTSADTTKLWLAPLEGGVPTQLTDGKSRDDSPAWSPDGRYLAFVSNRTADDELFLMRADGSAPTQLTHAKGADWLPRWVLPTQPKVSASTP